MGSALKPAVVVAIVGLCTGIAFAGAAMIGPSAARAGGSGPGCADFYACFWAQPDYQGDKTKHQASDCPSGICKIFPGQPFPAWSAKNRFSNRRFRIYNNDGIQIACLDPGENRPNFGTGIFWNPGSPGLQCP